MTTFAAELRRAIELRDLTPYRLARDSGVSESSLSHYLTAARLPTIATADLLADALHWPSLRTAITHELSRRCARCKRQYLADAKNRKWSRFCGRRCRIAAQRARYEGKAVSATRARVAGFERAIAAHCRGCEPDGLCRDAECELRPVSPFPFVPLSAISRRKVA